MEYLAKRRINLSAISLFGLGYFDFSEYSPFYDRLMFPLRDQYGELQSFQGRALFPVTADSRPKYYHEAGFDKGSYVYGLCENAERLVDHEVGVVTEGPFDPIALYCAGVPAVATLGSTFSMAQAYIMCRYCKRWVLWFDNDKAGGIVERNATVLLRKVGATVRSVPRHRPFKDPSEAWERAGFDGIERILYGGGISYS